ncbi:hypothetical protein D3C77_778820 [compost metagenome]
MKHYFYLSFVGTDENGEDLHRSGIFTSTEYKVSGVEIKKASASVEEEGLHLLSVSYLGQMTADEFENGTSA